MKCLHSKCTVLFLPTTHTNYRGQWLLVTLEEKRPGLCGSFDGLSWTFCSSPSKMVTLSVCEEKPAWGYIVMCGGSRPLVSWWQALSSTPHAWEEVLHFVLPFCVSMSRPSTVETASSRETSPMQRDQECSLISRRKVAVSISGCCITCQLTAFCRKTLGKEGQDGLSHCATEEQLLVKDFLAVG